MSTSKRPAKPAVKAKAPVKSTAPKLSAPETSVEPVILASETPMEAAAEPVESTPELVIEAAPQATESAVAPEPVDAPEPVAAAEAVAVALPIVEEFVVEAGGKAEILAVEAALEPVEAVVEEVAPILAVDADEETPVPIETVPQEATETAAVAMSVDGGISLDALVRSGAGIVKGTADLAQELIRFSESRIKADLGLVQAASSCRRLVDIVDCEFEYSKRSIAVLHEGATRLTNSLAALVTGTAAGLKSPEA